MKFSPAEIGAMIVAVLSFLYLVSNLIDKAINYKKMLKAPQEDVNIRLTGLETEISKINEKLASDYKRIGSLEDSHRIMLRGMSALLSHGINGNNVNEMEKVKAELDDYLYDRDR